MRRRKAFRFLSGIAASSLVAGTIIVVGITPASAAGPSCTFVPSGAGSGGGTGPTNITGVVGGTTSVAISCTGLTPSTDTFIAIMASPLGGLTSSAIDEADLGTLTPLSQSTPGTWTGTVAVPATFSASDTNAVCPVSQAQANAGLVGCALAVADENTASQVSGAETLLQYATGQPTPAAPTLNVSPTTAKAGDTVTVSGSGWWGNALAATPIANSSIDVGGVNPSTSSVGVSAATYSGPGGTLTPPQISGTFVVPCGATGNSVTITEPNSTPQPGTISASASMTLSSPTTPTITSLSPNRGPSSGGTTVHIGGCLFTGATAVKFGGTPATSFNVVSDSSMTAVSPAGNGTVSIVVTATAGTGSASQAGQFTYGFQGYDLVGGDGGVFTFGDAGFYGSAGNRTLDKPIVGAALTASGKGYWLVGADGGVFTYGDAAYLGSLGGQRLNAPIVGIAATPDGNGYWLVGADGGVFTYGDAHYHGSLGGQQLNAPIVGIAATPGDGYWLVGADGGVFTYGDATYLGSMGGKPLNKPVVALISPDANGYALVGADGGVFTFGDAPYKGSRGGQTLNAPIVSGIVA
jgi:hypothetical protein